MEVTGTITVHGIEVKPGTKLYDNGRCIQILHKRKWYQITEEAWKAIQKGPFDVKYKFDTTPGYEQHKYIFITELPF